MNKNYESPTYSWITSMADERPRLFLLSSKTVTATEEGLLFGRLSPLQEEIWHINAKRKERRRMRFILFLGRSGKSANSVRERGWKKKSLLVQILGSEEDRNIGLNGIRIK